MTGRRIGPRTRRDHPFRPAGGIGLVTALAGMAALMGPAPATAQDPEPEGRAVECICPEDLRSRADAARERADAVRERMRFAFETERRARLGLVLGGDTEVDGRAGVEVMDVPEGPAWTAGLRTGDVVVALDGADLGADPGRAVRERMADVEPGQTVTVTYYRDGRERTATVVTGDGSRFVFPGGQRFEGRAFPAPAPPVAPARPRVEVRTPRALFRHFRTGDLDLVAVNPQLGRYFGTERGVLVAAIAEDSRLGLRAGDVILAIDGRDVDDPSHARSILASYRDDETVTLRVVRDQRTISVTGRLR